MKTMMKNKFNEILIIVTGAGYKKALRVFHNGKTSEMLRIHEINHKINIGAATAKFLASKGAKVCMVARSEEKLHNLKEYICRETKCNPSNVTYKAVDLLDENSVSEFVISLDKTKPIWLVHSIGLSAQMYEIGGDNPYIPFTQIPSDLITKEFETPVKSLLLLMRNLEPVFQKQKETKIVVVTSMSGVRPFMYGYSHASAKAGIHSAVRSLSLEMNQKYKSVYLTEILPGIVDTGMYDSDEVIKSVREIGESFGFVGNRSYTTENFPLMHPLSVAEAIFWVLESNAHILSVNMIARGQFANMGA
jgi:short-subunit dehydrogenase